MIDAPRKEESRHIIIERKTHRVRRRNEAAHSVVVCPLVGGGGIECLVGSVGIGVLVVGVDSRRRIRRHRQELALGRCHRGRLQIHRPPASEERPRGHACAAQGLRRPPCERREQGGQRGRGGGGRSRTCSSCSERERKMMSANRSACSSPDNVFGSGCEQPPPGRFLFWPFWRDQCKPPARYAADRGGLHLVFCRCGAGICFVDFSREQRVFLSSLRLRKKKKKDGVRM